MVRDASQVLFAFAHLPRAHSVFISIASLQIVRRNFVFRYRSFDHWLEIFRTYYGPVHMTFKNLSAEKQIALTDELHAMLDRWNRSGDRTLIYPGEYLEVVATKA